LVFWFCFELSCEKEFGSFWKNNFQIHINNLQLESKYHYGEYSIVMTFVSEIHRLKSKNGTSHRYSSKSMITRTVVTVVVVHNHSLFHILSRSDSSRKTSITQNETNLWSTRSIIDCTNHMCIYNHCTLHKIHFTQCHEIG